MEKIDFVFIDRGDNNEREYIGFNPYGIPPLNASHKVVSLSVKELSNNLKETICSFDSILNDLPCKKSGFMVDELKFNLSINMEGKVSVIAEVGAGSSAGIEITLRRNTDE